MDSGMPLVTSPLRVNNQIQDSAESSRMEPGNGRDGLNPNSEQHRNGQIPKLMNYTIDDKGRRIPAPAHKDREQLLHHYRSGKLSRDGLIWSSIKKPRETAEEAQRAFHLKKHNIRKHGKLSNTTRSPAFVEPLFPPLPLYGPPNLLRQFQLWLLRFLSFWLTLGFLLVIILGAIFTVLVPKYTCRAWQHMLGRDPDRYRKFYSEEKLRAVKYKHKHIRVVDSIAYYSSLVDIEVEQFTCETLDGFTLHLQRLHDKKQTALHSSKRYPVLLLHGLLQSAGAFCVNDEDSLAFYLCKQGFDVWLGNNRCWFDPERMIERT